MFPAAQEGFSELGGLGLSTVAHFPARSWRGLRGQTPGALTMVSALPLIEAKRDSTLAYLCRPILA